MAKLNKNIFLFSLVFVVIIFSFSIIYYLSKSNLQPLPLPSPSIIDNEDSEPSLIFGQITREDRIKHIEWAYRNNKQYEQIALTKDGPKDYAVTFYQPNLRDEDISYEERRGGILVFDVRKNQPKLIWESKEYITLTMPVLEVRDITNDGNVEILVDWSDGIINNLFIYSWTKEEFKFISPTTVVTSPETGKTATGYRFVVRRGDIQVKDLDGDGIDEVIISGGTTRDELGNEVPIESETIYKWDIEKQEYYLWEKK